MKLIVALLLAAVHSTGAKTFSAPKTCSYMYEDPHFTTFDDRKSNCQGRGDFILSRSRDSDFQVQARFTLGTTAAQKQWKRSQGVDLGSVTKALVIKTGFAREKTLEIDADVRGSTGATCKMNYLVDGKKVTMGASQWIPGTRIYFQRRSRWKTNSRGQRSIEYYRNFYFHDSRLYVQIVKRYDPWFGCYLNHRICIPDKIKNQNINGLFGNANGNKSDEFFNRFDQKLPTPKNIGQMNQFCEENWCVKDKNNSLFNDPDINGQCKSRHDNALEEAVKNVSDEIKTMCEGDEDCIEDTLVTGDPEVGRRTLEEKKQKEPIPETEATPDDEEEDDVCRTKEGHIISCDAYDPSEEASCEGFGYDFGFKMDGCKANADGPFQSLTKTDENPTCAVGNFNIGHFEIDCASRNTEAVITPSVDAVIKVNGVQGGTVYTDLKAGETYSLTTGKGTNMKTIQAIEFCFKCPESVEDGNLIRCAADVKACPIGTEVKRDPQNNCEFPVCPTASPTEAPLVTTTAAATTTAATTTAATTIAATTTVDDVMTTASPPGTKGDPHFKTHGGEMYDFHGGCDLLLMDNPDFMDGLGMLVHIRTKIETWWSYVESTAIKIGDDVIEIGGGNKDQWMFINGKENEELVEEKWYLTKFAGLPLRYKQSGPSREAHIFLQDHDQKIMIKTYNDFVKVELKANGNNHYANSLGLLGRFPDGERVGRDGETFIEDVNAFGQEWQVLPEEPKLFHSYDADWVVPAGQKCAMPEESVEKTMLRQRRLANGMDVSEAEKACGHLESPADRKACIYDVIATQDVNMAAVW